MTRAAFLTRSASAHLPLRSSCARPAFRWNGFARVTSLLLALLASPAFACAVCGAGEDDPSRTSYIGMTIIISLLPLGMLGGIVGYVFMKSREPKPNPTEQTGR